MIDDSGFKTRFNEIFKALPECYAALVKKKAEKRYVLITDETLIDQTPLGKIGIAGQVDGLFYFRLSKIEDAMVDEVICHEIAHFYLEERDQLSYMDFQTHPFMSDIDRRKVERLRDANEREAIRIGSEILRHLRT